MGAAVGSDVPFFLASPCAVVEGRGEVLHPCPGPVGLTWLVAVPDFSVLSVEAYRWLDESEDRSPANGLSRQELCKAIRRTAPSQWKFFNSFSRTVYHRFPVYREWERQLSAAGALFQGLSGSGSAYFGIFPDATSAQAGRAAIKGKFRLAGIVNPVASLPLVRDA